MDHETLQGAPTDETVPYSRHRCLWPEVDPILWRGDRRRTNSLSI